MSGRGGEISSGGPRNTGKGRGERSIGGPFRVNVIPNSRFGGPPTPTPISLPSYDTLVETAPSPSDRQLTLAAANAPLRYTYGYDRIAPLIVNVLLGSDGALLLDCVIGEGPIGGVVTTEMNDAALPLGVSATVYDGTQTTVDASLVAAWLILGTVYTDIRPGVAYAVIRVGPTVDVLIDERSITFTVQGLKCYDPRQNWFLRSEEVNNAAWGKSGVSILTDTYIDPEGNLTAEGVLEDSSTGPHLVTQQPGAAVVNGTAYGFIWRMKDGGRRYAVLDMSDGLTGGAYAYFDLQTGVISQAAVAGGAWTSVTATIAALADGWYECSIFGTLGANNTINNYLWMSNAATGGEVPSYTGGGTAVIKVCKAQFRKSASSAGYVKTVAAIVDPITQYTNNPALCLADFLAHPTRGPGDTMDWDSVGVVAARADQILATKKRHTFGLTFDQQRPKKDIEETMRTGVCFVVREGPTTYLVADAPVDVSTTPLFASTDWQPRELRYSQRDSAAAPNRITVRYTNTSVKPWGEAYTESIETADVIAGLVDAVELVVNATWVQDLAEAVRLRNRYFAEHTLGLKTLSFPVFEKGYKLRRGDVIRLTNDVDLTAKPVRVQRLNPLGFARVQITASEYQGAMYSDDTPNAPTYPGTGLPDPRTVLPVTAIVMTEEVYLDQLQTAAVASGAKYVSRFRCTWTAPADRYLVDYVVRFLVGTQLIFEGNCTTAEYVSPQVQQSLSYTVEVRARNVLGFLSVVTNKSQVALGKLLPPGAVTITQAIEIGGDVLLAWTPSVDIDVIRYECKYTPNSVSGSWESATLIDRIDGLRARFKGLPVGTHRFYVKAIDSVPQYSTTAAYADLTITSDSDAFLQGFDFIAPTLTNMIAYRLDGVVTPRWITNWVGTWDANFTGAMSGYTNPIATYGHPGGVPVSRFQSETQDFGALLTGDFAYNPNTTVLSGTPGYAIFTSPDNAVWTKRPGLSYTGETRYVYVIAETDTAAGGIHITLPPNVSFAAVSRKESGGPVTSNAGTPKTISLTGLYFKAVRITITPRGVVARNSTLDNVVLSTTGANSFDVYLFDQAGTQVASDFDWSFEGI